MIETIEDAMSWFLFTLIGNAVFCFLPTGLLWFFSAILNKSNFNFWSFWKWLYLIMTAAIVFLGMAVLLKDWLLFSKLAKKWNVPISSIDLAFMRLDIQVYSFENWSEEEFKKWFQANQKYYDENNLSVKGSISRARE